MKKAALILLATLALPAQAVAQTVTTTTVTQQATPGTGQKIINLGEFDLNGDKMLSSFEVGEMLFKFFDADGSGMIDGAEYERRGIFTVAPMEKETTVTYDYNNDGIADQTRYRVETFMQDTTLARFDANKDGLSPREFVDTPFATVDADTSNGVDLTEWRNAYVSRLAPMH